MFRSNAPAIAFYARMGWVDFLSSVYLVLAGVGDEDGLIFWLGGWNG